MATDESQTHETPPVLSPVAQKLIDAVTNELKGEIVPRHKINKLSPSFPFNHRTMANKDSLKIDGVSTGVKEFIMVGGRRHYVRSSLIAWMRAVLSKSQQ